MILLATGVNTVDVKSLLPDKYNNFTIKNFICEPTNSSVHDMGSAVSAGGAAVDLTITFTKTYNASTGILTITFKGDAVMTGGSAQAHVVIPVNVYLVEKIKNLA